MDTFLLFIQESIMKINQKSLFLFLGFQKKKDSNDTFEAKEKVGDEIGEKQAKKELLSIQTLRFI